MSVQGSVKKEILLQLEKKKVEIERLESEIMELMEALECYNADHLQDDLLEVTNE